MSYWIELHQVLIEHFNEEELRTLCFYLVVDYDGLPASGKNHKARELLSLLQRQNRLLELVEFARELRPQAKWPSVEILLPGASLQDKGARNIPPLLPYLPNRGEQEFRLGEALRQLKEPFTFPILCITHGDEFQCHDMFLERLKEITLPKLLDLHPKRKLVSLYPLHWPASLKNIEDLVPRLRQNLSETLLNRSMATLIEINKVLELHSGPVIIHTHILTEDWQRYGSRVLGDYLKFWHEWPSLSTGQQIFVVLFVKYQMKHLNNFVKRLHLKWLNKNISDALQKHTFSQFKRLTCVVLPRLTGITRLQAENWALREEIKRFYAGPNIMSEIRKIYFEWENEHATSAIPMEFLAEKLRLILER